MAFIEIQNLNKFYGATQALFDVSLEIEKGAFVTLLGPSGSGKTTLLKILAGFEAVESGRILMEGREISSLPPEKRNFGLVFQGYALFPHMSVFNNIAYPLRVRRLPKDVIAKRVQDMLDLIQLGSFADRKPHQLSGGQQQRVALARALVFQPDLLLLDEPMSALDKKLRLDLQNELRDIHQTLGTTFINVTHDQEEAMHMSDRIAVMNHGRIEQYASAFELYRQPQTRFVADFIGKSNMIDGIVAAGAAGSGATFQAPGLPAPIPCSLAAGKAVYVLRPEDLTVHETAQEGRSNIPGRILNSTYSGDRALYTVRVENGVDLDVYGLARTGIHLNDSPVFVSFNAADGLFFPQ